MAESLAAGAPASARSSSALPHAYTAALALLSLAAIAAGGFWPLVVLGWLFLGHVAMEVLLGNRFPARDPAPAAEPWTFTAVLLAVLPLQVAILGFGLWRLTLAAEPATVLEWIGIVALMGSTAGSFGITAAHELVHRREGWQRAAGIALLLIAHIPHFRIEHVHNHHPNVGTPKDPATAREGESVYAFFPRSIVGQYRSAWGIEADRMRRRGRHAYGAGNRMLHYLALQAVLDVGVLLLFGWAGLAVLLAQALIAVWLLETVNYVEHYGLSRRPLDPEGRRYEKLSAAHSWNAGQAATNVVLFNLGLHSAHHMEAARPYPALYNGPDMPQLPTGYSGSVMLAMNPPLWFRLMAPRLAAARAAAAGATG